MITDTYSKMISDGGMRRERELNMLRSGSAPPTVEGSLDAYGGIASGIAGGGDFGGGSVTEEQIRSDPAYIAYYYNNVNLNPRLPPPLPLRSGGVGGGSNGGLASGSIGDKRKLKEDEQSLFWKQFGFSEENGGEEWRGGDGLVGGLGMAQKSTAEMMIQDGMSRTTSTSRHLSRPVSRAFDDVLDPSESHFSSQSYASALGVRSTTADPHLIARAPSPRIPSAGGGRISSLDRRNLNIPNSSEAMLSNMCEHADLVNAFAGMGLSVNGMGDEGNHMRQHPYSNISESSLFHKSACSSAASYLKGHSTPTLSSGGSSPSHFPAVDSPNSMFSPYGLGSYIMNPSSPSMLENQLGGGNNFPPLIENIGAGAAMGARGIDPRVMGGGLNLGPNLFSELQNITRLGNNQTLGGSLQMPQMDPMYLHYRESSPGNSYTDLLELQKAYFAALLASQKSQNVFSGLGKSGGLNHGYYGNLAHMAHPGSPLAGALLQNSPFGPGSPVRHGEMKMHFPSGMRNLSGVMGSNFGESFPSSLLEEFKSNKSRCFELSEIEGHVVEFSADQYGSRFIQQKLETATTEEKNMVFHEIMPQALSLMTDVFGNYVIQKFFEHGSASQIRELADQLSGHVLVLSLQMYGCRVIQKAIEMVELDQQTKMVTELDGHIMRCVRDQNGNHVIQKCIECIPQDAIQFIVSTFIDQVVTLSTHPYGCRVIQRVLEHCHKPETQSIVMKEIMKSICMLAQDQYGNYVVQHVLEHGKPEERTCIINKLKGQIVLMSHQKFASNVVEKCLTFGTPEERQLLVNEMLGSDDETDPLQVMMKDQFANYVVQKVLETCDDQQLELILNRIKLHLNALKKYTYGKHIVARVEKLVAAGERRISDLALASYSA